MPGKFVLKKGPTGKFRFNLVSTNGQVVATSEAYDAKASAMRGIRAVKSLAAEATVEDETAPTTTAARSGGKAPAGATKAPAAATKKGGACGYYTSVSLFGGPAELRGCGQTEPPGDERSASPSVTLPPEGSSTSITAADTDGAMAQYGPAILLSGKAPADPKKPLPPSGPLKVSTKGKTSVTSTASIKSVGAGPFEANEVSSKCTASKSGVTASTKITGGVLVTALDANGNPKTTKSIPTSPKANYTLRGTVANGDKFKAVFNEQKKKADGTITVNAVHLYLLGPVAVGDVVIAQSYAKA